MRKKVLHFSAAVITSCVLLVSCSKDNLIMPASAQEKSSSKVSQPSSTPASTPSNNNNSGGCNHGGSNYPQPTGS